MPSGRPKPINIIAGAILVGEAPVMVISKISISTGFCTIMLKLE